MKVNEGQKMTEFTRTSTPKNNNNIFPECRIELSPIQNPVHSTLVQPSFSEHADISDKRNALKLNLYSDDSDYKDNIPLKIVQNGLNAISRESPICRRTRNTNHHDVTIRYDWMKLNKKFIQCAMWDRLETTVKKEMDQLPSLPNCFIGDKAVDGDQVDMVAKKDIPSDILQRFNVHYPICIVPDGNCFCGSISQLVYGSEDLYVEMRCRIVIDSVLNLKNYTDHDYLMRCVNHVQKNCSNIAEYYCYYSGVKNVGNQDESLKGIQSVFIEDVMRICSLKEYCGPWLFHSAANVLTTKLVMVFPSRNIRSDVRMDYNRVFCPSEIDSSKTRRFGLLWTSVCSDNRNIYNHIVPLITRYNFGLFFF